MEKVAVLLVNYGQWDLTRRCIESLGESEGVEVHPVLVDNASPGEVPAWVAGIPRLRFLRAGSNLGFTGGNDAAFGLAESLDAPWTFILNNDTTVSRDTVRVLAGYLAEHPEVGIVTPPVFFAGEPDRIWSAGGRFVPRRMLFDQDVHPSRGDLPASPEETDFASGCAMMIRSSLFRELGGFREGFFIYHEDSVLCRRVTAAGSKIVLHPGGEVMHHVSVSSGGVLSPFSVYFTHRNRMLAAKECLGPLDRTVFFLYVTAMTLAKTLLYPLRGQGRLVRWMWLAWLHGISGREGGTFPALEATRIPRRISPRRVPR